VFGLGISGIGNLVICASFVFPVALWVLGVRCLGVGFGLFWVFDTCGFGVLALRCGFWFVVFMDSVFCGFGCLL